MLQPPSTLTDDQSMRVQFHELLAAALIAGLFFFASSGEEPEVSATVPIPQNSR